DDSQTPMLLKADIAELQRNLAIDAGEFQVLIPAEAIRGLLSPFNSRARHVLVSLLRGYSVGMAAASAGISNDSVLRWGRSEPSFGQAVQQARDWGFRRTAERELQRRAMAGSDDKASGRLLELWVKREDAAYREKSQIAMEVTHKAGESLTRLVGGYVEPETP
ncbi:MAG: hypothetical protein RLZZ200_2106, partial [Pseudomonadota bacterium]